MASGFITYGPWVHHGPHLHGRQHGLAARRRHGVRGDRLGSSLSKTMGGGFPALLLPSVLLTFNGVAQPDAPLRPVNYRIRLDAHVSNPR